MVPGAGHCLVGVGKIQELVLTVKTVWRTNENGHPSASGSPGVTPAKGQKGPVTALGRGQGGVGPMLGGDG